MKMEMMSRSACSDAPRDVANLLRLSSSSAGRDPHVGPAAAAPASPSAADAILTAGGPQGPPAPSAPTVGETPELRPQFRLGAPPTACALAAGPPRRRARPPIGRAARGRGLARQGGSGRAARR